MAARRTEALVTPALLAWARQQAGLTPDDAAQRLNKKVDLLAAWEAGTKRPTMNQARELAALYGQPLGVLYLDSPPIVAPPPTDYRARPEGTGYSPELLAQIRHTYSLRDAAVELAGESDRPFSQVAMRADLSESPSSVAERIRKWLGVPVGRPKPWRNASDAFRWWRRQIEDQGILIFIVRGVDRSEMSGFTLAFDVAPAIGINGSDIPARRLFSLIHELVHVLLRADGVSDVDGWPPTTSADLDVERFCNAVAAAALMPRDEFVQHERVAPYTRAGAHTWADSDIRQLANDFGVSLEAAYRRLVDLQISDWASYVAWKRRQSLPNPDTETASTGGPDFYRLKIHDLGLPYLRQVYEAYHAQTITLADVCEYLGVRADTAHKLETRVAQEILKAS